MARLGPLRFQPQIPKAAQSDKARDHCCEIADLDTLDAARNLRSRCPASWGAQRPSGLGDFQLLKPRVYATAVPGLQTNPLHRVRPSRWEQGAAERKSGTGTGHDSGQIEDGAHNAGGVVGGRRAGAVPGQIGDGGHTVPSPSPGKSGTGTGSRGPGTGVSAPCAGATGASFRLGVGAF